MNLEANMTLDKACALRRVRLNLIFAEFLIVIAKHVKKAYCQEICVLIVYLRLCLNEIGWEQIYDVKGHKREFCEAKHAEGIARISNEFVTTYLPRYLKTCRKEGGLEILGVSGRKFHITC